MTLFNAYVESGAQKYQRTQIEGVKFEFRKAANVIKSGLLAADSVTVYIPLGVADDYLKPKVWMALVSKSGYWTLKEGDYMVKGLVSDEITTSFTITSLKAKYDDVVQIRSVDTMDTGSLSIHHYQVGAS
jgi:hypothetical protein